MFLNYFFSLLTIVKNIFMKKSLDKEHKFTHLEIDEKAKAVRKAYRKELKLKLDDNE